MCQEASQAGADLTTGPFIGRFHWYTVGSEELLANSLSSFSRAALYCWYLHILNPRVGTCPYFRLHGDSQLSDTLLEVTKTAGYADMHFFRL